MDDYLEDLWTFNESERDLFEVFDSGFESPSIPDSLSAKEVFEGQFQREVSPDLRDYTDLLDGSRNV